MPRTKSARVTKPHNRPRNRESAVPRAQAPELRGQLDSWPPAWIPWLTETPPPGGEQKLKDDAWEHRREDSEHMRSVIEHEVAKQKSSEVRRGGHPFWKYCKSFAGALHPRRGCKTEHFRRRVKTSRLLGFFTTLWDAFGRPGECF